MIFSRTNLFTNQKWYVIDKSKSNLCFDIAYIFLTTVSCQELSSSGCCWSHFLRSGRYLAGAELYLLEYCNVPHCSRHIPGDLRCTPDGWIWVECALNSPWSITTGKKSGKWLVYYVRAIIRRVGLCQYNIYIFIICFLLLHVFSELIYWISLGAIHQTRPVERGGGCRPKWTTSEEGWSAINRTSTIFFFRFL